MWTPGPSDIITKEYRAVEEYQRQLAAYQAAIQAMLDTKAKERGYDSIFTAVSYVNSTVPSYAAEAIKLNTFRDAVWVYTYAQLANVENGNRPVPTVEDFINEIEAACPFSWEN